jgi:GNAT superfamily N-acetyltransferase
VSEPLAAAGGARLRAATAADAGVLTRLRAALFEELGKGARGEGALAFERACEPMLSRSLAGGQARAWLVEDESGAALATATLLLYPRLPTPADLRTSEGYLLGVYTVPAARRRGLACALLIAAIEDARRAGLARIRLHATDEGMPLYASLGFAGKPNAMELRLG